MIELEEIRADFPVLAHEICLDNGTVSVTPAPVAASLEAYLRDVLQGGPPHVVRPDEEYARRDRTMERIAEFLGTRRERLALMRGVSEAYLTVLRGLPWQRGDRLVITEDEETALLLPSLHLRDEVGVEVVMLPFERTREAPEAALAEVLTERTRLVALSHVTTTFGYRYPVRELCAAARARGVLSFVDVAHSAGVVPLGLDDIGCDFAGVVSYKWMYGPYAAGALYVAPDAVERLALRFAGNRSEAWIDPDAAAYELRDDARRFEYGPWAWPIVHAWAVALDYIDHVGRAAIWQRTQALAARLHERLGGLPGVEVLTPAPEAAAALFTFDVAGISAADAAARLAADWGIRIKAVPGERGRLRASLAMFTSQADVDRLADAVERIAALEATR